MKNINDELIKMPLHDKAKNSLNEASQIYTVSLLYESKIIAYKDGVDEVQSVHVKSALDSLIQKSKLNWKKEIFKIIGGAFIGVFIPGMISSLSPLNIILLIIYITLGFIGLSLVFVGIINK